MEIDHALRREGTVANHRLKQKLYLHRSCVPLDVVDLEHERTLFRPFTNEQRLFGDAVGGEEFSRLGTLRRSWLSVRTTHSIINCTGTVGGGSTPAPGENKSW